MIVRNDFMHNIKYNLTFTALYHIIANSKVKKII